MRDTTRDYLIKRAELSGLTEKQLTLEPDEGKERWDLYIIFGGALDEEIQLGETLHEVNIVDWLAEHCAIEATIAAGAQGVEPEDWKIELYPAARFEGDSPIYHMSSAVWRAEHGDVTCSWGTGGDPGNSPCDALVTGHDMLCDGHRRAHRDLVKLGF